MLLSFLAAGFYVLLLLMAIPATRSYLKYCIHTAPTTLTHKYAPLDALRGLAALWVACVHLRQFPQPLYDAVANLHFGLLWYGHKAVPVFVVLSGYLVYKSASGIRSADLLRTYVLRRFFRIYPVFAAISLLLWMDGRMTWHELAAELTLSRSFGYSQFINPASWSLFVEVSFYFVVPLLAAFRGRVWNALFYTIIIFIFAATDADQSREYALWKYFFLGIFLVEIEDLTKGISGALERLSAWGALIAGNTLLYLEVFNLFHLDDYLFFPVRPGDFMTLGLGLGTVLVIYGCARIPWICFISSFYIFNYLAAISYSLFLSHPLMLILVYPQIDLHHVGQVSNYFTKISPASAAQYIFVLVPAALFFATIIHVLFEAPGMRYRSLSSKRGSWAREPIKPVPESS